MKIIREALIKLEMQSRICDNFVGRQSFKALDWKAEASKVLWTEARSRNGEEAYDYMQKII
jgi:hypothetical protein